MRATSKLVLLGAALGLIVAACGDDDVSPEVTSTTTVAGPSTTTAPPSTTMTAPPSTTTTAPPSTTTTATPSTTSTVALEIPVAADVTETYEIPGFGFSIDYPIGWFVETRGSITVIAQTEEQLLAQFSDPAPPGVALAVSLDHRSVAFLRGFGLTVDNPTPKDLLEFNTSNFDWTEVQQLGEVEVFGTTALMARFTDSDGDFGIEYQGIRPDTGEIFLFGFGAPTEESLDAFLPTWDAIFESITVTE